MLPKLLIYNLILNKISVGWARFFAHLNLPGLEDLEGFCYCGFFFRACGRQNSVPTLQKELIQHLGTTIDKQLGMLN